MGAFPTRFRYEAERLGSPAKAARLAFVDPLLGFFNEGVLESAWQTRETLRVAFPPCFPV